MRESPSIIPWGDLDRTVYLVLDDFGGKYGWALARDQRGQHGPRHADPPPARWGTAHLRENRRN